MTHNSDQRCVRSDRWQCERGADHFFNWPRCAACAGSCKGRIAKRCTHGGTTLIDIGERSRDHAESAGHTDTVGGAEQLSRQRWPAKPRNRPTEPIQAHGDAPRIRLGLGESQAFRAERGSANVITTRTRHARVAPQCPCLLYLPAARLDQR